MSSVPIKGFLFTSYYVVLKYYLSIFFRLIREIKFFSSSFVLIRHEWKG